MPASSQLRQFLAQSRALSPADLETVIALADLPDVRFVRLEPKGAVVDDVLTGIHGVIHVQTSASPAVIQTLLEITQTSLTLTITRLGIGNTEELEVTFATPDL